MGIFLAKCIVHRGENNKIGRRKKRMRTEKIYGKLFDRRQRSQ